MGNTMLRGVWQSQDEMNKRSRKMRSGARLGEGARRVRASHTVAVRGEREALAGRIMITVDPVLSSSMRLRNAAACRKTRLRRRGQRMHLPTAFH